MPEYTLLSEDAKRDIRSRHLLELEATHYRLTLEEAEEPGANPERTRMLTEIERRARGHRTALGFDASGPVDVPPENTEPE